MNPEDAIAEKYFHECFGLVADAAFAGRQGGELSIWIRMSQKKLLEHLRKLIAEARQLGKPEATITPQAKSVNGNGHTPMPAARPKT